MAGGLAALALATPAAGATFVGSRTVLTSGGKDVAVASNGNIYVAAGTAGVRYYRTYGTASPISFGQLAWQAYSVAVNDAGTVAIMDTAPPNVYGRLIRVPAGGGAQTVYDLDRPGTVDDRFGEQVAIDGSGRIGFSYYRATWDTCDHAGIGRWEPSGAVSLADRCDYFFPQGVGADQSGTLFLGEIYGVGNGDQGQAVKIASNGVETKYANLGPVTDIDGDSAGNVFVLELVPSTGPGTAGARVLQILPSGVRQEIYKTSALLSGLTVDGWGDVFVVGPTNVVEIYKAQPTSTSIACGAAAANKGVTCSATVADLEVPFTKPPAGTVAFSMVTGTGTFSPQSCTLAPLQPTPSPASNRCSVTFTPKAGGSMRIAAQYGGTTKNVPSRAELAVSVAP